MQVKKIEYTGQVIETINGIEVIACDRELREGVIMRNFYVSFNGEKSRAYSSISHAKAQCKKLFNAGKDKHDYMS